VAWWAVTRIMVGVGDLMQRTGDGRTGRVLGGQTIGRSGDVVLRSVSFLVEPQNKCQWFASGLGSKPLGWFVSGLASKAVRRFLSVWPQNR
jgi:hypothetical protein